jgi:multimeric flavodoxin WrbA
LIELADFQINGNLAAGVPLREGEQDDFPKLIPRLTDPKVRGLIIGTPVYFGNMSSLCKAFLDRCIALYQPDFALSGKVAGVLACGGTRNGGQEVTIQAVQVSLLCQEMILVGNGRPGPALGRDRLERGRGRRAERRVRHDHRQGPGPPGRRGRDVCSGAVRRYRVAGADKMPATLFTHASYGHTPT